MDKGGNMQRIKYKSNIILDDICFIDTLHQTDSSFKTKILVNVVYLTRNLEEYASPLESSLK